MWIFYTITIFLCLGGLNKADDDIGDVYLIDDPLVEEQVNFLQKNGVLEKEWINKGMDIVDEETLLSNKDDEKDEDGDSRNMKHSDDDDDDEEGEEELEQNSNQNQDNSTKTTTTTVTPSTTKKPKNYAIIPCSNNIVATISYALKSMAYNRLEVSFSFMTKNYDPDIQIMKVNIEEYESDGTLDKEYTVFNFKDFTKLIQTRDSKWSKMRFIGNEDLELEHGGRLILSLKTNNGSIVSIRDVEVKVVPRFDDKSYDHNIGPTTTERPGSITTPSPTRPFYRNSTTEIILIVLVILLALFSIFISYKHWVLKMNLGDYEVSKNDALPQTQTNPVFSGHHIPAERYGARTE